MKIAVIGANGQAGKLITNEAVKRGYDVTAIVRSENKSDAKNVIKKDLFALTKEDVQGFDVIVTAFGAWTDEDRGGHTTSLEKISDLISGTQTRLLAVGGAGSLYIDEAKSKQVFETPDFPKEYLPTATAMAKGLDYLRTREDVRWTYVSPSADFDAEGARTGEYILAGEVFTVNAKGESRVSYADYAIAMIDLAEVEEHIQKRVSVVGK